DSVDSATLVPLKVHTTTIAMDVDTLLKDIEAQIAASGIENNALADWDSFYNVGKDNYDRSIAIQDKEGNDLGEITSLT
ncbi:MAG: hypothetical protein IKU24_02300, partial [Clostridia bacterium]|nr:hypothetical protein [Clostridia bacterium]